MTEPSVVAEQLRKDYTEVFNTEAGMRVFEDLKRTCFYYTPTLDVMPHVMAYNEGQRNVLLHIETKLKLSAVKLKELENERGQLESD
jgi:hypothetical protein